MKRFMVYDTFADRDQWIAWARTAGIHCAVLEVAKRHERLLDEQSPRTWKYVSDLLWALGEEYDTNRPLARDALLGYLPVPWVDAVLAVRQSWDQCCEIEIGDLLRMHAGSAVALGRLASLRESGRTDVLERIAYEALRIVSGDDLASQSKAGAFDLASFERLLPELPGDHADRLQAAFGSNPEAATLLEIDLERVLNGFTEFGAADLVSEWLSRRATRHRAWALATGVIHALDRLADIECVRTSRSARIGLGALLVRLTAPQDRRFRDALVRLRIDPVLPAAMRHRA